MPLCAGALSQLSNGLVVELLSAFTGTLLLTGGAALAAMQKVRYCGLRKHMVALTHCMRWTWPVQYPSFQPHDFDFVVLAPTVAAGIDILESAIYWVCGRPNVTLEHIITTGRAVTLSIVVTSCNSAPKLVALQFLLRIAPYPSKCPHCIEKLLWTLTLLPRLQLRCSLDSTYQLS